MPSKPPNTIAFSGLERSRQKEKPDLSEYPDAFVIRTADLLNLKMDHTSTDLLTQLADILILFESACFKNNVVPPSNLANSTVFVLTLLMNISNTTHNANQETNPH